MMAGEPHPPGMPSPAERPADAMKAFARDQVEAVRIACTENDGQTSRTKLDACYLALQYLDDLRAGESATVERVIRIAREFEQYLAEP